jgi:putative oxidoreductase
MNKLHAFMHRLHSPDWASLFLRLALGVVFTHAGWLKLANLEFVIAGFTGMGIPAWLTYVVAYSEFIGGLLLLAGFLVRYVGVVHAVIMLTAMFKVHWPNGYGLANNGYEYVLALLLASLAMVTLGAGKYSLARLFRKQ